MCGKMSTPTRGVKAKYRLFVSSRGKADCSSPEEYNLLSVANRNSYEILY